MAVFLEVVEGVVSLVLLAARSFGAESEGGVDGQAVQPRENVGFATKSIDLTDHLHEHILSHVLGVRLVAEHAPGQGENTRRIVPKHLFRRGFVAIVGAR